MSVCLFCVHVFMSWHVYVCVVCAAQAIRTTAARAISSCLLASSQRKQNKSSGILEIYSVVYEEVLCCVVLCCVVLYYVVLYYVVLYYVVLYCAGCCVVFCVVLCYVVLCLYVMLY
jgi:hypothetical protein